jgi:hypothetical protein
MRYTPQMSMSQWNELDSEHMDDGDDDDDDENG